MRKQIIFTENKKTIRPLGFSGKVKQIFVNSYKNECCSFGEPMLKNKDIENRTVGKLTDTKIDMEISGLKLLDDYVGSPVDEFNILTEEFDIGDMSEIEVNIDGVTRYSDDDDLVNPVVLTFIFELPEKQKRTDLR